MGMLGIVELRTHLHPAAARADSFGPAACTIPSSTAALVVAITCGRSLHTSGGAEHWSPGWRGQQGGLHQMSSVTPVVSLLSCRNVVRTRTVIAVKRQRMKMMKMTPKKQRRMRMRRRKCCYRAWRGKRRCTPWFCVLQLSVWSQGHLGDSSKGFSC